MSQKEEKVLRLCWTEKLRAEQCGLTRSGKKGSKECQAEHPKTTLLKRAPCKQAFELLTFSMLFLQTHRGALPQRYVDAEFIQTSNWLRWVNTGANVFEENVVSQECFDSCVCNGSCTSTSSGVQFRRMPTRHATFFGWN